MTAALFRLFLLPAALISAALAMQDADAAALLRMTPLCCLLTKKRFFPPERGAAERQLL